METLRFRELSVIERSRNTRRMVRERVYERRLGEGRIRVYSSVVGPTGRKVGRDAIRVQYWVDDVKVYGTTRVHRVVNWRRNLLQRIYQLEDMVGPDGALRQVPRDSTGRPMVVRKARKTGKPFWGSSSYPHNKETRRFATETFASAIVISDKPRGIVGQVMMNHWLIEQARIEVAIQDLENAVRFGLITEDELMHQLMRLTEYHAEEEIVYAWPGDLPTEAWEYALAKGHGKQYLDGVFGWVREGQEVQWHDPDVDNRDPTHLWIISDLDLWEQFKEEAVKSESLGDIGGFILLLQSKDGISEAEVHVDEITPWFEPPPLYGSLATRCMGCGVLDLYAYDLHRTKRPSYIDEDGEGQSIGTVLSCMFCEQLPDDVWITNLDLMEVLGVD